MTFPRLVTPAFEAIDNPDGSEASRIALGPVDLTASFADKADRMRSAFVAEEFASGLLVQDISPDLPETVRKVAWDGRLALPRLREDVAAFVDALGGPDRIHELKSRLDLVKAAERRVESARETLREVSAATLVPPSPDIVMYYAPGQFDPYVQELDEAYSEVEWEAYAKVHPRPPLFEGAEQDAWLAGLRAAPKVGPLHVFATLPQRWDGLDPAFLRSEVADAVAGAEEAEAERLADLAAGKPARSAPILPDAFDVEEHIYSDLQDHYEDAQNDVVDLEGLHDIVSEWRPHAGKGTPEDLALEARLAEWNERQTIVSYHPDMTRILSIHGDDHAAIVARCERDVRAREADVEAASSWEARQPEPAPAP